MQNPIYVVEADKAFSQNARSLSALIEKQGYEAEVCTLKQYQEMIPYADTVFEGSRYIFVGTDLLGISPVQGISAWRYNQFGCRIGWMGDKCAIYALSLELPYSEYQAFRNYCKELSLEYGDVVVPHENPLAEAGEFIKELAGKKENRSAQRAQYSVIVHEFMDNFFMDFVSQNEAGTGIIVYTELKSFSRRFMDSALLKMTKKQAFKCHAIIHTCAAQCAAAALLPVPLADTVPITASQISMVVGLGMVFHNKITKSDAKVLLQTIAAPLAGRAISKNAFMFVPGVGWAINGSIAAGITECLGWSVAGDFAAKSQKRRSHERERT